MRYVERTSELQHPDLICIPGTKNTISDLKWFRASGLEAAVKRLAGEGTPVIGICGGYQILGTQIVDACGMEGGGQIQGMGLLPIVTHYEPEKMRKQNAGVVTQLSGIFQNLSGKTVSGYELHMGKSWLDLGQFQDSESGETGEVQSPASSLLQLSDGLDGCCKGNVLGTYLHGLFYEEDFRNALIQILCSRKGIVREVLEGFSMETYQEEQFDKLADTLRRNLDMDAVYRIMGL